MWCRIPDAAGDRFAGGGGYADSRRIVDFLEGVVTPSARSYPLLDRLRMIVGTPRTTDSSRTLRRVLAVSAHGLRRSQPQWPHPLQPGTGCPWRFARASSRRRARHSYSASPRHIRHSRRLGRCRLAGATRASCSCRPRRDYTADGTGWCLRCGCLGNANRRGLALRRHDSRRVARGW